MKVHCIQIVQYLLLIFLVNACVPVAPSITEEFALTTTPEPVVNLTAPPINTPTLEPTYSSIPPTNTPLATTAPPTDTPRPRLSVSGLILDQVTGEPVAEAEVSAGSTTATTDSNGRYTLADLTPGQYVISVVHQDYDPGLSPILSLGPGKLMPNLELYPTGETPYPEDPMLTNPLDPNGAPTPAEAERLAREQGLTGAVTNIQATKLSGEYLVNYKIGDDVRAAVAEIDHEVWELTDDQGQTWWIIKVCGNLASPLPDEKVIPTPKPIALPPMAEVLDELIIRACASMDCVEMGTVSGGERVEVYGCLADGGWCEVGWSNGRGWCTGQSLRQLAVAEAVPVIPGVVEAREKIAFVSDRDDNDEIYVMNADGSDLKRLTNHPDEDRYPAWSPGGQRIAFSREGIYVMKPDGSDQIRLTEFGGCPAWSPDGQRIAFSHSSQLYVMNSDGSGLTRLGSNINCPTWLPDGQHIAYFLGGTWVMRINVNGQVQLVDGSGPTSGALDLDNNRDYIKSEASIPDANYATWSFDGRQIAFESFGRDRDQEIYKVNSDGTGLIRLTNHPGRDTFPAWSLDGQQIAFVSERDGNKEIYVMKADGSGLMRLTEDPANDRYPAWSPVPVAIGAPAVEIPVPTATPEVATVGQGQIVFTCVMYDYKMNDDGAFVTHPADGSKIFDIKNEICAINPDGSNLIRLTHHSERNYARDPAWSPDKKSIAFSDNGDIYVMNADGSGLTRLTSDPDRFETAPTWSPDGQRIAFCSDPNPSKPGIYVINADGSGLTHLVDYYCFNPEWSPDGSKIALDNMKVMNADGSNLVSLIDGYGNSPSWSPDSQKILFARSGSPNSEFFVINANGSDLTRLTDFPASEYWPNWSPDGQKIIFHSNRHGTGGSYDLYIMNADGSGMTRLTEIQELDGGLTKFVGASYPDW